jgi:hypothetical protein
MLESKLIQDFLWSLLLNIIGRDLALETGILEVHTEFKTIEFKERQVVKDYFG